MIRSARTSRSYKMQMRVYGSICAISGISFLCIYLANRKAYLHGYDDRYIMEYAVGFLVLAVGLLAANVWAELLLDVCLSVTSLGILVAIIANPFELGQTILDLCIVTLLTIPVALTILRFKRGEYSLREGVTQ